MKQRYSSLDVKAAALELSSALVGLRIANIYDLSSRTFLFKAAKPDVRKQFVVDAGFRCHLTEYSRATAPEPSPFISRLRKFLKSRRITRISQVGTDRILHFEFNDGQSHLFLEFFAAGNIILTDREFKIAALFRNIQEGSDQDEVRVGLTYVLDNKQNYKCIPPASVERLKEALEEAGGQGDEQVDTNTKKKGKRKKVEALRRALAHEFPEYPPPLIQHALHSVDYDSSLLPEQVLQDNERIEHLMRALQVAEDVRSQLETANSAKGYILSRPAQSTQGTKTEGDDGKSEQQKLLYEDFHPFEPTQFPDLTIIPFDSFNKAVDEFFSSVEAQKLESRLTERENAAKRKLDAARRDQEKRVGTLKEVQELHILKAQAIEANMQRVEEAMNAVNSLIAHSMDWTEIARLIEMEQGKNNPVAKTIKLPLKLYENTITLLLSEPVSDSELDELDQSEEEDSEQSSDEEDKKKAHAASRKSKMLSIDIDLGLTPWSNATQYYDQKKTAAVKEEKTVQASNKALKSAERKINADLKEGMKQEKPVLRPARTPFWFEKFFFFISSEGYLVLGGRDAQQNDLLYRRHLKRGDVYVHADIKNAVPVIVKNRIDSPNAPIPPGTLSQAGTFSVTTSTAWDSKALMGAWWVKADQVSKTAHTGDYVATGDVVIRGDKNHIAPGQLILGFAVLFQITPESIQNHTRHRVPDDDVQVDEAEGAEDQLSDGPAEDAPDAGGRLEDSKEDDPDSGQSEAEDQADYESSNRLVGGDTHGDAGESGNIFGGQDPLEEGDHTQNQPSRTPDSQAPMDEPTNQKTLSPNGALDTEESKEQNEVQSNGEEDEEEKGGEEKVEGAKSQPTTSIPSRTSTPSAAHSTTYSKPQQQVRGKRAKRKKLAEKYKDQDEEDRELALRLLGSAPKSAAHSTPTASPSHASSDAAGKAKPRADKQAEMDAQKQRRRVQHERAAQAERRRQEALRRGDEIVEGGLGVDEVADLKYLPSLVGTPVAGDEVIAAIPVCAPWSALGQYKYRVKMQPGSVKKGKAVREILGRWHAEGAAREKERAKGQKRKGAQEDQDEAERGPEGKEAEKSQHVLDTTALELIKGWRDVEVMNTLPVNGVRIIAGAGPAGAKPDGKAKGKKGGGGGVSGKGGKGAKGAKGVKGGKKK